MGVFSGIGSWAELERTYTHLVESQEVPEALIEENIPGDDYRLLVLGDQVLAACKRIPANVVGDGESSIETLITNKTVLRKRNPFLSRGLIRPDYEVQGNSFGSSSIDLTPSRTTVTTSACDASPTPVLAATS